MPAPAAMSTTSIRADWKGAKEPGSFNDLKCAPITLLLRPATPRPAPAPLKAGDTILVHAGAYRYHPGFYTGDRSIQFPTPVEGTYYLFGNGTPDKPIVIRKRPVTGRGVRWRGNFNLFNVEGGHYKLFGRPDLQEYRDRHLGRYPVPVRLRGLDGEALPLREYQPGHLHQLGRLGPTSPSGQNTFIRRARAEPAGGLDGRALEDAGRSAWREFPPTLDSYPPCGVMAAAMSMAFNYVANFHDGIDVETYGNPDGITADPTAANGPWYPAQGLEIPPRSGSTTTNNYT